MSRREYFKDYRMLNKKVMDSLESKEEIESYGSSDQSNEDNFSDGTMLPFLSQETSNVHLTEDTADSSCYLDRESIYEDSYAISVVIVIKTKETLMIRNRRPTPAYYNHNKTRQLMNDILEIYICEKWP